jgi:hypothetical protein
MSASTEPQTCGQGLARHAALPAALADLTEAMADNLQAHMQALDLDDHAALQEHGVYLRLAEEQRQAAARLRSVAGEMAGARDLPMGHHDQATMTSPQATAAFQRFVEAKRHLAAVLQELLEEDRRLLADADG